ncbi:PDZ domain-containing protein [Desulfurobacterium sp.]
MRREELLKRFIYILPDAVISIAVSIVSVALGIVLSLFVFYKNFTINQSLSPAGHKKVPEKRIDYSGIDKFFLSLSGAPLVSPDKNGSSVVSFASGRVLGTIITGKNRFLLVSDGSSFKILKEGDTLNGRKIVKITQLYYQLDDGTKIYILSPGGISAVQKPHQSFPVARGGKEHVVHLDRTMVEKETADIGKLLKDVNIVPVLRHGETIGYRFLRIRPGTILTKIGFRNGDIVTAVNDMPVRTVEDAFKIYNMLRNEDTVKVEIERRGRKEVIIYEIR